MGWRVDVLTGQPHYPMWKPIPAPASELRSGVAVRRYPLYVPRRQTVLTRGLYEISWLASAARSLGHNLDPDAILGVCPSLGGAVLAAGAAIRYRVPYCLFFQDLVGRGAIQSGISGGARVAGALEAIESTLAAHATVVGVASEAFVRYFRNHGIAESKLRHIRNPVRLRKPTEARDSIRRRLGWSEQFVVLHTGSMGLKQGLHLVLEAASQMQNERQIRFVLQGDGNQREHLVKRARALALKNVAFVQLASEDDFANTLEAADVLLLHQLPTVQNMSLPAKLGTYFAAGRPIVAAVADADETAREVQLAGAGMVVPPGDPQALFAAITRIRQSPALADDMGRAGVMFASQHLRQEDAVLAVEAMLANAVATARSGG